MSFIKVNIGGAIDAILRSMTAAETAQRALDEYLNLIFNPRPLGTATAIDAFTASLEAQADQLRAQIQYNEAYGQSVDALRRQLEQLNAEIERQAATAALVAAVSPSRTFGGTGVPHFAEEGIVPGPIGRPRLVIAEGGEHFLGAHNGPGEDRPEAAVAPSRSTSTKPSARARRSSPAS
jgi:hypothetical protein